jgi:hypothetical protein
MRMAITILEKMSRRMRMMKYPWHGEGEENEHIDDDDGNDELEFVEGGVDESDHEEDDDDQLDYIGHGERE